MSMSAASLRSGEVFRAISAAAAGSLIFLANHLRYSLLLMAAHFS